MTSHENNEAGDVRGLSDEQRTELRRHLPHRKHAAEYEAGCHGCTISALLVEVDTLRERLAEAESALEAGDACGAVGCRAMERLAKVEALADELDKSLTGKFIARELRAALSTERGEGRE